MKKKKDRDYIMRKMIKWIDLKNNFCNEIIKDYKNCKLKNLKIDYKYNDWNKLINNKEWKFNEKWNNY